MSINEKSIMDKVRKFSKTDKGKSIMNDKIRSYMHDGVSRTNGNSTIATESDMIHEAEKLKRSILDTVQSLVASGELPECIYQIVNEMNIEMPFERKSFIDGETQYEMGLWFDDDMIKRQSLMRVDNKDIRTGNGINNIVAMFNNGVDTDKTVFGIWENHLGEEIFVGKSKNKRPALRFMQDGIESYKKYLMTEYGGMNIYIYLNTIKYGEQ